MHGESTWYIPTVHALAFIQNLGTSHTSISQSTVLNLILCMEILKNACFLVKVVNRSTYTRYENLLNANFLDHNMWYSVYYGI